MSRYSPLSLFVVLSFGAACPSAAQKGAVRAKPAFPKNLVLWDGDTDVRQGGGWSGPNSALNTLLVTNRHARSGRHSLHWHKQGSGLVGASWNLWNYQAGKNGAAGFDLSGFRVLRLWMKLEAPAGKEPQSINLSLIGWSNRRPSAIVNVNAAIIADGQWREIVIPIQSFLKKPNARIQAARTFDARTVWEIGLSSWSDDERSFDLYLDDISADGKPDDGKPDKAASPKSKNTSAKK